MEKSTDSERRMSKAAAVYAAGEKASNRLHRRIRAPAGKNASLMHCKSTIPASAISRKFTTVVYRRQHTWICYAALSNLGIIALNQLEKMRVPAYPFPATQAL
jgi:hypothetical protein